MAAQVGSLYVSLTMNSQPFQAGISRAQQVTARASAAINRDIGLTNRSVSNLLGTAGNRSFRPGALIAVSRGFDNATDRASLFRSSLLSLTAVAGGFGAAIGANLLSRYADTFVNLSNQIRTVTNSSENLATIQNALASVSDRSRASLQATTTIYARTARATEHLGLSQEKLLRITETVQKAFSIGGATSAEAQGAAVQLSQGIASDRFSGEEFRSVAENAPVLLRGMAESLGVTIGQLREMAHAGELTAAVVTQAILDSTGRIESEFAETSITIDRALGVIDNQLITYVGSADKAYGITSLLASSILAFGDNLDTIIPILTTVAGLVGAVFLSRNKGALGGGIGALLGGAGGMALGGLEGALIGSIAGGVGGVFAGTQGKGLISDIKKDSIAAKERVLQLTEAQKDLRATTLAAAQSARAATQQSRKDPLLAAGKSFQSAYQRQAAVVEKLDAEKLANNERIVQSMQRLASVTADITPKAAKAASDQVRGEEALADAQNRRLMIQQALKKVGVQELGALGMQATSTKRLDILNKATERRRALQVDLLDTETTINKERERMSQRELDMAQYATEADKRAYAARMEVLRNHNALVKESIRIEDERAGAVGGLRDNRVAAEADGLRVLSSRVDETSIAYRASKDALLENNTALSAATRSATLFGRASSAVKSGVGSLVAALGGKAGIAITATIGIIGYFISEGQKAEHQTKSLKEELRDLGILAEDASTGVDSLGKSLDEMADDELRNKLREISGEMERIRSEQNPFQKIFSYQEDSLGNMLTELQNLQTGLSGQGIPIFGNYDKDPIRAIAPDLEAIIRLVQEGSIGTEELTNRLNRMAAANPDMDKGLDSIISRLRDMAPFMDALVERSRQIALELQLAGVESKWAGLVENKRLIDEQITAMTSLQSIREQMISEAGASEAEAEMASTLEDVVDAWMEINEEKGITRELTAEEIDAARAVAAEVIRIQKAEAERRDAVEETAKKTEELRTLMSDLSDIQSEISRDEAKVVDERAAERVQQLVSDLRTGKKSAFEVKLELQAIANTGISSGMQGLIDRTLAALPLVAQLLGMMRALPGSTSGNVISTSSPGYEASMDAPVRKRVAQAQAITTAYEAELARRAALNEKAKAIEDRAQEIMDNVPVGGAKIDPAAAKEQAAALIAMEDAMSEASGGGSEKTAYVDAIKSIRERTAALQLETDILDLNTYASEKARIVQELENAAKEDGLALSPARVAAIDAEASAYARVAAAQEVAIQKQREAEEQLSFYRETFAGFFADLNTNMKELEEGETFWDAFGDAAAKAIDKISSRLIDMAANGLFDLLVTGGTSQGAGGGGGIFGFLAGLFGGGGGGGSALKLGYNLANGGQVRGPGTSRSDSIAAMLSNGEFVVNARAARNNLGLLHAINDNQPAARLADGGHIQTSAGGNAAPMVASSSSIGSSGGVNLTFAPSIDARGADAAAVARLERNLQSMAANFDAKVVGVMKDAKKGRHKI